MSFGDLIKSRRSIRKYTEQKIPSEIVKKITSAALMSPASKRRNPWEFIVVQDEEMLRQLSESREHGSQMLACAPLAIVVTADTTKSDIWIEDASIAAIIIQLQAEDLGLGSCWVQIYNREKEKNLSSEIYIKKLLNIPEQFSVLCIVSIGYKNEDRQPHDLEKLAYNKVHQEMFK